MDYKSWGDPMRARIYSRKHPEVSFDSITDSALRNLCESIQVEDIALALTSGDEVGLSDVFCRHQSNFLLRL